MSVQGSGGYLREDTADHILPQATKSAVFNLRTSVCQTKRFSHPNDERNVFGTGPPFLFLAAALYQAVRVQALFDV